MRNKKGFTLIEVLLVIVIIAILAGIVIIAVNPSKQVAQANNTQRSSDVKALVDAVHEFAIDNRGTMPANLTDAPTVIGSGAEQVDICDDLVPNYVVAMPFDPITTGAHYTDCADYDTGYEASVDENGRLTISAPTAELGAQIFITR